METYCTLSDCPIQIPHSHASTSTVDTNASQMASGNALPDYRTRLEELEAQLVSARKSRDEVAALEAKVKSLSAHETCVHPHVEWRYIVFHDGPSERSWWECRDCQTHFIPQKQVENSAAENKETEET